jgi:RNAse (barnase) inhibitor barstar
MTIPNALTDIDEVLTVKLLHADASSADDAARSWAEGKLMVRIVRGQKMRSTESLFDECAAALQFPHYFGENWPAFDECLSDMYWLLPSPAIVLVVLNAAEVLADEARDELRTLVRVLDKASRAYAVEIERGEWWDRPALPFHVVLQASADVVELEDAWRRAGATMAALKA